MQKTASTYIVEPQGFFAPYLARTLAQANLNVLYISSEIDYGYLQRESPDVIFIDADFLKTDVAAAIRDTRRRSPRSIICIYTSQTGPAWARACHVAGANAVFTKLSSDDELIVGMRTALDVGAYTDPRYLPTA